MPGNRFSELQFSKFSRGSPPRPPLWVRTSWGLCPQHGAHVFCKPGSLFWLERCMWWWQFLQAKWCRGTSWSWMDDVIVSENGLPVTWWHSVTKFTSLKFCDILWHFENSVTKCDKAMADPNLNFSKRYLVSECLLKCFWDSSFSKISRGTPPDPHLTHFAVHLWQKSSKNYGVHVDHWWILCPGYVTKAPLMWHKQAKSTKKSCDDLEVPVTYWKFWDVTNCDLPLNTNPFSVNGEKHI